MRFSITASLIALVTMGGHLIPAHGEVITGTLSGDSTLTPTGTPGVYVQSFTGDGDDTTFGAFTPTSQSTVDFSKPPAITITDGMFSETFAQGTLFGTSSGSGAASGHGTADVTIDFVFTGGTGLFAGDSGEATFTGTITQTSATTESITGSYTGTISTTGPSTLVLLTSAAAAGAVVVVVRRKRAAIAR